MVDITKKAILVALLLSSCKQEKEIEQKKYFDLKKLYTSIIQELKVEKPQVEKHWQIGSKKESKTTNDIDWEKELSLFLDADLNKSAYLNSYKISEKAGTKTYILKSGERLPVKKMVITEKPNKLSTEIYVKTNT